MGLRQELTEPWGIVTAGVSGGLGWAVVAGLGSIAAAPAVAIGLGVGAVVYGVKVAAATLGDRPAVEPAPQLRRPPRGSPADVWLRRAEGTVRTLHEQTESPREPAVRGQVGEVDDDAATVLAALRRLAAQATAVEDAQRRIDVARLQGEQGRISAGGAWPASDSIRAEQQRSLSAIAEQLEVARRLGEARNLLLARMQSTVIGLEGLVARLAEVLALSASAGGWDAGRDSAADQIADLTTELDGLRSGLEETEAISRRALGGERTPPAPA